MILAWLKVFFVVDYDLEIDVFAVQANELWQYLKKAKKALLFTLPIHCDVMRVEAAFIIIFFIQVGIVPKLFLNFEQKEASCSDNLVLIKKEGECSLALIHIR